MLCWGADLTTEKRRQAALQSVRSSRERGQLRAAALPLFSSGIAKFHPAVLTAIRPARGCCGHFGVRLAAAFPSSNPHPSKASAAPAHRKKKQLHFDSYVNP